MNLHKLFDFGHLWFFLTYCKIQGLLVTPFKINADFEPAIPVFIKPVTKLKNTLVTKDYWSIAKYRKSNNNSDRRLKASYTFGTECFECFEYSLKSKLAWKTASIIESNCYWIVTIVKRPRLTSFNHREDSENPFKRITGLLQKYESLKSLLKSWWTFTE